MKKRFLSWLLVLAMILTGVPMATAAGSGFVSPDAEAPSYEGGPLELPVDTGVEAVRDVGPLHRGSRQRYPGK